MSPLPNGNDAGHKQTIAVAVSEASQVGEARRSAAALVARLGFDTTAAGKVALVVTEAANNLLKHAGGGEVLLGPIERDSIAGIEVLALDRGPGIFDLNRSLGDGFSTAGSPGTGLGAIARLSSEFDIHSAAQLGTALCARLWSRPLPPAAAPADLEIGAVNLPCPGETVCGDSWALERLPGRSRLLVADGLGHGPLAAEAAREAVRIFRENTQFDPVAAIQTIHSALRSTRGAAVAVMEINVEAEQLRYAGVGNISGTVLSGGASKSLISHNGTVGHQLHKVQEFTYSFPRGSIVVMHSDGLATSWRLDKYPGLAARDPSLVAGVLYRDFKRGRDDVTVVAVREPARNGA